MIIFETEGDDTRIFAFFLLLNNTQDITLGDKLILPLIKSRHTVLQSLTPTALTPMDIQSQRFILALLILG